MELFLVSYRSYGVFKEQLVLIFNVITCDNQDGTDMFYSSIIVLTDFLKFLCLIILPMQLLYILLLFFQHAISWHILTGGLSCGLCVSYSSG